ncbi:MAG: DMT family transporter, partial [Oscillospiraceae bacterium]
MHKQTKGCILLLLCAMIWGAAFVAQSESMQYVGPFTMGATRFFLAGLVLLPVIRVLDRKGWSQNRPATKEDKKRQLAAGAICGVLLFAATTLQQFGLLDTTVGKSGFVTALYIVFVLIVGVLTGKKRASGSGSRGSRGVPDVSAVRRLRFSVAGGDLLTLGCTVLFTFHICYISAVSPRMDGVRLSCVQFFVCSALSAIGMFVFESPDWASIRSCWLPIVYAGVFSGGVAYTFQIIGERDVQPAL